MKNNNEGQVRKEKEKRCTKVRDIEKFHTIAKDFRICFLFWVFVQIFLRFFKSYKQ